MGYRRQQRMAPHKISKWFKAKVINYLNSVIGNLVHKEQAHIRTQGNDSRSGHGIEPKTDQ